MLHSNYADVSKMTAPNHSLPPADEVNAVLALYNGRRYAEAESGARALLGRHPEFAFGWKLLGGILQTQGKDALPAFQKVTELTPADPEAHYNLGVALKGTGRFDEAAASYRKAIGLKPDYAEAHSNLGNALKDLGRLEESIASYRRALTIRPNSADAHNNLGTALKDLGQLDGAIASYCKAVNLKPDFFLAYYNLGNALNQLGQSNAAVINYRRAIELKPDFTDAHNNLGIVLKDLGQLEAALASYDKAIAINSNYAYLYGARLHTKMLLCDWVNIENEFNELMVRINRGKKAAYPFPVLAITDNLSIQRKAADIVVIDQYPANRSLGDITKLSRGDKIRIGYYSADFHNHATTYLMAELFERHNKNNFELIAFSFGPNKNDEMRKRVCAMFDQFIDVRYQSDKNVAILSRKMAIDIAVDLKGLTLRSRPSIFSYRAAPIQVGYIGYPGTVGAEYIDYIIADKVLIPEASRQFYSEKVVYLPNSYQVNDSKRQISDKQFTRAELGLPEGAFVFCCFNNNFKITPRTFDGWMRILQKVDGSVLWLLQDNPTAAINLRKEVEARGIKKERLIFAGRLPLAEHLARHRLADLFLDTLPCNAHTTASDALWAGLPVLTCVGEAFASRVAASLLNAVNLPELITQTQAEYEALAIEMALQPEKLEAIKAKLQFNRLAEPLFDCKLFTKHIEDAYTQMYERYHADLLPAHIYVN